MIFTNILNPLEGIVLHGLQSKGNREKSSLEVFPADKCSQCNEISLNNYLTHTIRVIGRVGCNERFRFSDALISMVIMRYSSLMQYCIDQVKAR